MFSKSDPHLRAYGLLAMALMISSLQVARADNSYSSEDKNLTFSYPRRWKAEKEGDKVRLTPSDGSGYLLQIDSLEGFKGESPATDSDLKLKIAKMIQALIPKADFVSGSSLTMDHGSGAVFRYRPTGMPDAPATSLYIAFVGKHSVAAMPEKAGQSSLAIGMSSVFQSLSFADSLPKPAPVRTPRAAMPAGKSPINLPKVGTISYVAQIAPIMKESCEVCHNSRSALGGLSVSRFVDTLKGGRHTDDIVAGRPESSLLLDYLTGKRTLMPKGGNPLSSEKIALIRKWIAEGARETPESPAPMMSDSDKTAPTDPLVTPLNPALRKKNKKVKGAFGAASEANPVNAPLGDFRKPKEANVGEVVTLEGYSGHLVSSDIGFTIEFRNNKTARAVWKTSPGKELVYIGNYSGEDGNYLVEMNLVGEPDASAFRSIRMSMRARGGSEDALFGSNGNPPGRNVASLSLSEAMERTPSSAKRRTNKQKKGGGVKN